MIVFIKCLPEVVNGYYTSVIKLIESHKSLHLSIVVGGGYVKNTPGT